MVQESQTFDTSQTLLSETDALALASRTDTATLVAEAKALCDSAHGNIITYSKKVFIPLSQLCRDVCHYCTFARTPKRIEQAYMSIEQVLELCLKGAEEGCQEALFTLGEKPELRYRAAREALAELGFESTIDYVTEVAANVLKETGLIPHINAGNMTRAEMEKLRRVSASMGIMLESASSRLCEKGMPHYGSPDKDPATRLETIELAGQLHIPFTSGILIGIGETRLERIESLLALRRAHQKHGHLQEVIVQNFRAKENTKMAQAPEPDLNELIWTLAVARLIFGAQMNIQAPPNLSPGVLPELIKAGINDWGGVSPLTPDHVNPEAPWPHLESLAKQTVASGKFLDQRLTIYPEFARNPDKWLDEQLKFPILKQSDSCGFAKRDNWVAGAIKPIPDIDKELLERAITPDQVSSDVKKIVADCEAQKELSIEEVSRLFESRGADFTYITQRANQLRHECNGDTVSFVVNRNINYTNVCYFKCQFCAFSKGKQNEELRGRPYDISAEEISRRTREAWDRGATEVCMQGGIHPDYSGQTYLDIVETVRHAAPDIHIHAFSPLEVWQGANTLGVSLEEFLKKLKAAGLNTLPGTAAEILDDELRQTLCADKLSSEEWLEVMETAHKVGFKTTATIMYGHIDRPEHWAKHLLQILSLQRRSKGFTEFVPLPYGHMEAPLYLKGLSRRGPSFREAVLMHAVARLVFHGQIENIQTSWVKMGLDGVTACLNAGANDLGGTLMNESITRAAGASYGQEWTPEAIEDTIRGMGRLPRTRNTLYDSVPIERYRSARGANRLREVENNSADKKQRSKKLRNLAQAI